MEDCAAIDAKIRRGIEQLDRGEEISGDEALARLREQKAAWLQRNLPAER